MSSSLLVDVRVCHRCTTVLCTLTYGYRSMFWRACVSSSLTVSLCVQFKPRTTRCRSEADQCDLSEYCHGDTEFCPHDAYKVDGTECRVAGQKVRKRKVSRRRTKGA